jgi:hypothetical protein
MKFLRSPKGVTAQRSRARHLAYKRRPIEAKPRDELIAAAQTVAAMLNLSPIAMRDYIEWLRNQPTEENHNDAGTQSASRQED